MGLISRVSSRTYRFFEMRVKVKTIDQQTFNVDIDDSDSVEQIKSKIQEAKNKDPALEPSISKLIWKGKILKNDQTVESAGINEKGFFVIMPGKVVKKVEEASVVKEDKSAEKKVEEAKPKEKEESGAPQQSTTTQSAQPTGNSESNSQSTQPQIAISDELLATIVGLGIDREKALLALQVARGNPDVAVDLIMSGNLEKVIQQAQSQANQPQPSAQTQQPTTATPSSATAPSSSNPLAALASNPAFQQMLAAVRENPEILPQMLQQIQQTNPQLLNLIQENHEAFLQLMNDDSPLPAVPQGSSGTAGGAPAAGGQQDGQISIQVTPGEREAIQRLMALGVSELEAAQAYMACEKDEAAAANFLLDQHD